MTLLGSALWWVERWVRRASQLPKARSTQMLGGPPVTTPTTSSPASTGWKESSTDIDKGSPLLATTTSRLPHRALPERPYDDATGNALQERSQ